MKVELGLFQEQALKLVMTPELRQAISILQFSSADLMSFLHEQANENPVIELAPEADWKELSGNRQRGESSAPKSQGTVDALDFVSKPADTLFEHLESQLGLVKDLTNLQRKVALYLIGNLDEKGYLEMDIPTIAGQLGVSEAEVEDSLTIIRQFDPPGIAASNLEECILLQLRHFGVDDERIVEVVQHHLSDLASNRLQKIADALGISIGKVQQIADRVRKVNPRPGSAFARNETRWVAADVVVKKAGEEYHVLVNETSAPGIVINPFYQRMLQKQTGQEEAKQFIHEKINGALWLIKSLEQRRMTLTRVTQAIVDMQRDFLDHGIHSLKPMTQKEIADRVGMHESTISRAISNKYVQTPRGLFELKYFFSSALSTADGDAASSESVKKRLKQIIADEDKRKPLSDQAITDLLAKEGLEISRRTVAKYREELMILPSSQRKRF